MRTFTREELKKYNGVENPAYVAYKGKVYDVSESLLWEMGSHMGEHIAGYDLTKAIENVPHGPERLESFPVVGELKD
jgi:predicted heme/steroid binding protein